MTDHPQPTESAENLRQKQLLAPLRAIRDPQSRLAWAVEQAQHRSPLPDNLRLDQYRIEGCLVRIWLVSDFANGVCNFRSDSDAASLKALAGILCDYYSGEAPAAIIHRPPDFLQQLGLLRHLAENRRATVLRIGEKIREFAATHLSQA